MSDAFRRALRTFLQAFIGTLLASGLLGAIVETGNIDLLALKTVGASAFASGVIALLTFLMNALEDRGTIPALLKAPASNGADPLPE